MNPDAAPSPQAAPAAFELTPPEALTPLPDSAARSAVPLPPKTTQAVDEQLARFIEALLAEDLHSEPFKARLDSAFALGREEISVAASLMQGRLLQRNFVGVEDSPAYQAIQSMRVQLDALNPGRDGDLLQPRKLLGFIPFGNRLQAYFRKFQGASAQLQKTLQQLYAARDDLQRDVVDIEATRSKLWEAMQQLAAAIRFAEQLDQKLTARIEALQVTEPDKARALQQEVLFHARQNLQDMLTQQAVCTHGYLALDVLKKTGRELMNGCSRVATTGMSALAVAQTVARATGSQMQALDMLAGVNASIDTLMAQTGRQLGQHVERTTEFAQNPLLGIERLSEMFDQTFQAMDAMDSFRTRALETMAHNHALIKAQLARADTYLDRTRARQAREAGAQALSGPVAL